MCVVSNFLESFGNKFFFFGYCLVQVNIEPEANSTKLNKAIMTQLVKLHRDTDLGKRLPVYDGREALYTAGVLPFISKEFTVTLAEEDEGLGTIKYEIYRILRYNLCTCFGYVISMIDEISHVFTLNNYVRKREFKVTIKFVAHANMHQLHELVSGKQVDTPQEALKVIDIVLKELASQRCVNFTY